MKLSSSIKALTKMLFQRSTLSVSATPNFGVDFSLWNEFWRDTAGGKINYERELGDLRSSALLIAAHTWVTRGLTGARLKVVSLDKDNKETEIQDHPLTALIYEPNDYYGGDELFSGTAMSWLVAATSHWLIVKDKVGDLSELWYEPWWSIRPVWPNDGSVFISGYQVNRNGEWLDLSPDDVLCFRNGIDPDIRQGQSATPALLREYYTDRQAAEFAALLMRQGLVPPLVVSLGDKDRQVSSDDMRDFKEGLLRLMSGNKAGEPAVINAPANIDTLNYDYGKIGLREVRAIPEERFCAAMGISPYSLNFGISRSASTYSNVEQYLKQDYRAFIIPLHKYIAKRLQTQLLPLLEENTDKLRVCWDYSDVPLMAADLTVEWTRVAMAYKSRILDQAEAREAIGYASDDTHKGIYYPVPNVSTTTNDLEEQAIQSAAPPQLGPDGLPMKRLRVVNDQAIPTGNLDAGRDWWRTHAPKEARALIDAGSSVS